MMDLEAAAWEALGDVKDPCSLAAGCAMSLVEMQIVKSVEERGGGLVVTLQLTEPSCLFSFHIAEDVKRRLADALGPDLPTEVRLSHDPRRIWTEDMILPEARKRLTMFRANRSLAIEPAAGKLLRDL